MRENWWTIIPAKCMRIPAPPTNISSLTLDSLPEDYLVTPTKSQAQTHTDLGRRRRLPNAKGYPLPGVSLPCGNALTGRVTHRAYEILFARAHYTSGSGLTGLEQWAPLSRSPSFHPTSPVMCIGNAWMNLLLDYGCDVFNDLQRRAPRRGCQ